MPSFIDLKDQKFGDDLNISSDQERLEKDVKIMRIEVIEMKEILKSILAMMQEMKDSIKIVNVE